MYLIRKVYDDNSFEIFDLGNWSKKVVSKRALGNIGKEHLILGAFVYNGKILDARAVEYTTVESEEEAYEYISENPELKAKSLRFKDNYVVYWTTPKRNHVRHYVKQSIEYQPMYLGENNSMTPYKQGAKDFNLEGNYNVAYATAKRLNNTTYQHWEVIKEYE